MKTTGRSDAILNTFNLQRRYQMSLFDKRIGADKNGNDPVGWSTDLQTLQPLRHERFLLRYLLRIKLQSLSSLSDVEIEERQRGKRLRVLSLCTRQCNLIRG